MLVAQKPSKEQYKIKYKKLYQLSGYRDLNKQKNLTTVNNRTSQ